MFLKIISLAILFYILYKFVFEFLLPIFKATRNFKKGFREMQERANMNQQAGNTTNGNGQYNGNGSASAGEKKKEPVGDYIDFEEIK